MDAVLQGICFSEDSGIVGWSPEGCVRGRSARGLWRVLFCYLILGGCSGGWYKYFRISGSGERRVRD